MENTQVEELLEKLKENEIRLKQLNEILLGLAKSKSIDSGDFKKATQEITEAATLALGCDRSSVWLFNEEKNAIQLLDLFQKSTNNHSENMELKSSDFPAYFKYLHEERTLAAHNARTDPSTSEFTEVYLKPLEIYSMLDAPIRYSGEMVGVICNENVGDFKQWSIEEENFAGSLADLIGRAIEAKKRKEAQEQLQLVNKNLEKLVIERTRELQDTLKEVSQLKQHQDGDYYLIHLIEAPLSSNKNNSKKVTTEFYLEQKKKVLFRDKLFSIGGDINISGNIYFNNYKNRYIAFLNGDAMGKSMQGAGGAIVLGTAFNHILQKSSRDGKIIMEESPEQWMKNSYRELNNIFQTFDGGMMASCVIGLVKESTGQTFLINAEHPNPVLYRDDISSYIVNKTYVPKLGTENSNEPEILFLQLKPGDVMIFGSDGKDDLKIPGENGELEYMEDEEFFLNTVTKSNSDIQKILMEISDKGEITDDISFLKLSYFPEVNSQSNSSTLPSIDFSKVKEMILKKDIDRAFQFVLNMTQEEPKNSIAWNLLANCFYYKKNYKYAGYALQRAKELNPKNKNIQKNYKKLMEKMQKLELD
ncbi:MAG: SpoIIE family protein phosphatase [Leptospiraceae bacterium]|nr:SpoIIE family protein phosphatase [Leptospiraceae bacterium]